MHIDDVKRMQAEKDHLMRNEGFHPANILQNWRSPEARDEDRARLAKEENDLKDRESTQLRNELLYGKNTKRYAGLEQSYDANEYKKETEEKRSDLERHRKDDRSYGD